MSQVVPKVTAIYEQFKDDLTGIEGTDTVDTNVDGTYHMAQYYSPRIDDDILRSIKQLAQIHLSGQRLSIPDGTTTALPFLSRLRCVDSLSDYLILALQAVSEDRSYTLLPWVAPKPIEADTGALEDVRKESDIAVVSLVHISDLMAHSTLNLAILTREFALHPSDGTRAPAYCFVSHAWVDKGMPDTKDAKFYRCLLLMSLAFYLDIGIEYFWIDYVCVTQDPSAKELKAAQLRQIPSIVQNASGYLSMCLEIYQYFSSAWCVLETLLFLSLNPYCHPLDFVRHPRTSTSYRFGMNVVDPTKVNANEHMIYSFTDQPFMCGDAGDVVFLESGIEQARTDTLIRVWRLASRAIKTSVGLSRGDALGVIITSDVLSYLGQDMFCEDFKGAAKVMEEMNSTLTACGMGVPGGAKMEELIWVLERCWKLTSVAKYIGVFWPGIGLRSGGVHDV